jgi:hypothetical protein
MLGLLFQMFQIGVLAALALLFFHCVRGKDAQQAEDIDYKQGDSHG